MWRDLYAFVIRYNSPVVRAVAELYECKETLWDLGTFLVLPKILSLTPSGNCMYHVYK